MCTSTLYLQEEHTVFIVMLEYYILSIKQGDEIEKEKEKTSQEELVSQERASQLKWQCCKYDIYIIGE